MRNLPNTQPRNAYPIMILEAYFRYKNVNYEATFWAQNHHICIFPLINNSRYLQHKELRPKHPNSSNGIES